MEKVAFLNQWSKNTLMETLDITFTEVGEDFVIAKMPVSSKVHQPYGILHGGATAALAETVGSAASALFVDGKTKIVKGIELSINHLKSKKEGTVFATAKMVHQGRTTHLWEIRIVDEDRNLISLCKITNIILDKK
ncbi:PaaI family thioesterase [Tenacibaculum maritimum]|uniref:Thioesterase superfamily protein n=2 Tax=Tenacibaculum maritimum TaxID=107401 RepID=A0A2H1EC85_9FLAO|nr:PaaI family thioesterase [Tenacibaculum maritimum]MCD9563570.1 PaaI family thioesterase [Tenacibaculum maritimum]MCD9566735.1 PaaI family thioesterase [Tenacibaculum maritimum]MCD9579992.1 PaaI family thioesterase [Tenacibaculum maritimum]MCD9581790.1 PaaI family thioesterase [Tenacibaculum maritimum]MCD9585346.1 PaaI family thioesterase [Tenacibaculum maritimum]